MATSETLFIFASSAIVLTGVGHTLAELAGARRPMPHHLVAVTDQMKASVLPMPGRAVSLFDLMRGFSLMMGALFIAFGVSNLALVSAVMASPLALGVDIAVCTLGAAVSARYLFPVPTVLMGIAALGFAATLFV